MPYRLRYHSDVKAKDIPKLNATIPKKQDRYRTEAIGISGEVFGAVEKNIKRLQKDEGWGLPDCYED